MGTDVLFLYLNPCTITKDIFSFLIISF